MEILRSEQIEEAIKKQYRQYLTGHMEYPQKYLRNIEDDIEIGISQYDEFTADKPHMHPVATEHGYVLEGALKVKLLDGSGAEYEFKKGDFFLLRPDIPYATKNAPGSRILFIKSPGGNDKRLVEVTPETEQWLSSWD